ncbi:MAG: hypothetical protein MUE46_02060 [Xanthomonadales bacterium]|nr:hypothetical protein [Xanthomonadales bacterium]
MRGLRRRRGLLADPDAPLTDAERLFTLALLRQLEGADAARRVLSADLVKLAEALVDRDAGELPDALRRAARAGTCSP